MSGSMVVLAAAVAVGVMAMTAAAADVDSRIASIKDRDHPWDFKPAFADRAAWEKRAEALRTQVMVSQGLWPMPEKTPLEPVIHGKIDRDGYTIEKVYFASLPGHYVTGNLYRPKSPGKHPAVVSPYGHWPNGRFIWQDDEKIQKDLAAGSEKLPEGAKTPLQARCANLAKMGCVVFHYDAVGYCDSKPIVHREGFTDADALLRLQSQMGLQSWNSIRAVDFVLGLDDVDPSRIAATGASGGGTQCILLGALDPRVMASFPVVMISMNMQGGCVCENAPLLRVGTNNVELACLFAPRYQGAAAAQDWTSDFEKRGLPEMKQVYGLLDAADRVEGKFFPYPHNYNVHSRELMYGFMNRRLQLDQGEPVEEKHFEPTPPEQLSVWDEKHALPKDAADAAGVRKWMTETSDRQLAELAKNPAEYAKVVRAALAAMVADDLPTAADVEIVSQSGPFKPGTKWDAVISRRGFGERVRCRAIVPEQWGGRVVVWSHPQGSTSLTSESAKVLLDAGRAVIALDRFDPGDAWPVNDAKKTTAKPNPRYVGFVFCHNRSILANRTRDLLSVIALAKGLQGSRGVDLVAFDGAGIEGLLARGLAGRAIDRAGIDLGGFDFGRVTEDSDPMLLPGGVKYGGVHGLAPLCEAGPLLLANPPAVPGRELPPLGQWASLRSGAVPPAELIGWMLHD